MSHGASPAHALGQDMLWPRGRGGGVECFAAAPALAAALARFRFERGVIEVIGVGALAGPAGRLPR